MEKFKGRVIRCFFALSMVACCVIAADPGEAKELSNDNPKTTYTEKKQITETVEVKPDVVSLLREEVRYTAHWDEDVSDNTLQISQDDAVRLMKISESEAGTEGVHGRYLVMRVIINRLYSDEYPDTIKEIITQPHQFESYQNGSYDTAEPTVEAHLALAELEKNLDPDDDIIAFEAIWNKNSLLRYFDAAYDYMGHQFYVAKN